MIDVSSALSLVEATFPAARHGHRTFTVNGRALRVVECVGAPDARYVTYVSFDALFVDSFVGVRADARLLPLVTMQIAQGDDGFHAAWLLERALSRGYVPKPRDIVVTLGHSEALPHLRFDYPFPWERTAPLALRLADLTVQPVLAYSVSAAETKVQQEYGAAELEALFEAEQVDLFDRARRCATS